MKLEIWKRNPPHGASIWPPNFFRYEEWYGSEIGFWSIWFKF